MNSSKLRLVQRHFPHYIHYPTRFHVLSVYKQLFRQARGFIDPLGRSFLQQYIYESFAAFKYVSKRDKINALVSNAEHELDKLTNANRGKGIEDVMKWIFTTYLNKELPLTSLIGPRLTKNVTFKIHNMPHPEEREFEKYDQGLSHGKDIYYRYIRALRKNKYTTGQNGRKLYFRPENPGTVLGGPLPRVREVNKVRKAYTKMIESMPLPVHPKTFEYLKKQCGGDPSHSNKTKKPQISQQERFYQRRIIIFLLKCFTVREETAGGELEFVYYTPSVVSSGEGYGKAYFSEAAK